MGLDATIKINGQIKDTKGLACVLRDALNDKDLDIIPDDGCCDFEITNLHRYYNKGYERGNWPEIFAIINFFMLRSYEVFYGDDSGYDGINKCTATSVKRIWKHFVKFGHKPYLGYTGRECPICGFDMWHNVYGMKNGYSCSSCDYSMTE